MYVIVATQSAYPVIIDGANQPVGASVPIKASARATPPTISSVVVVTQNSRTNLLNGASSLLDLPDGRRTSRVALSARRHNGSQRRRACTRARRVGEDATPRFYPTTIAVPSKAAHGTIAYM